MGKWWGACSPLPLEAAKRLTSLPKQKCKLALQHRTMTQLHKPKGVVGKWTGEAAGPGREWQGKRGQDSWVSNRPPQAENPAEGKFR